MGIDITVTGMKLDFPRLEKTNAEMKADGLAKLLFHRYTLVLDEKDKSDVLNKLFYIHAQEYCLEVDSTRFWSRNGPIGRSWYNNQIVTAEFSFNFKDPTDKNRIGM
jgi:hypothetical protein